MKEQIENMAKDLGIAFQLAGTTRFGAVAEILVNEGYRKQSEPISCGHENGGKWISVEDRLPHELKKPILVTDGEKVIVAYRNWLYRSNSTGELRCPANYGNGMKVTHWMPLPEPPKMKGE